MNNDSIDHRRRLLLRGLGALGGMFRLRLAVAGAAYTAGATSTDADMNAQSDMSNDPGTHEHGHDHEHEHDDHAHEHDHEHEHDHHHHDLPRSVKRSEAMYTLPSVMLVRQDGTQVSFPNELDSGRPVLLDFIYTSCTTICPLTSQIFHELQEKLGKEREKVCMVSISLDPEYDTPARLRAYAKKFGAGPQWQHYTGKVEASIALQKAFHVYRGDKMNHSPVTFLRAAPGKLWVRLDGFASPDLLLSEYHSLIHAA